MYVDGRLDNTFDIICTQYSAYEEFIKARGYQKDHIDLIEKFKEYFEITNDEKDFVKSMDISEWIIEHGLMVNIVNLSNYSKNTVKVIICVIFRVKIRKLMENVLEFS